MGSFSDSVDGVLRLGRSPRRNDQLRDPVEMRSGPEEENHLTQSIFADLGRPIFTVMSASPSGVGDQSGQFPDGDGPRLREGVARADQAPADHDEGRAELRRAIAGHARRQIYIGPEPSWVRRNRGVDGSMAGLAGGATKCAIEPPGLHRRIARFGDHSA
jgi:hypothetical protein